MRAFTTLLLVWVIVFAGADSLAAESIFAIGGGVGVLELGGLKAFLSVTAQPRLLWQAVIEVPAERRLSARFAIGAGSLGSISLTQLETLLLFKLGAKIYAGVGSGLMRFVGTDVNLWRLASYGLIGLKSEAFKNAIFFLDLRLIVFLPDIGIILAKGVIPVQFGFGMTFKL